MLAEKSVCNKLYRFGSTLTSSFMSVCLAGTACTGKVRRQGSHPS